MKKIVMIIACALCAACLAAPALANGTLMNLYIQKETLNEQQTQEKGIFSKNHELRVTRQSVYPWNEEGKRWAVFVEVENTSDDLIVIDETWLYTCKADKETTATWHFPYMDGAFYRTVNRFYPGERAILYAGSVPVYEPVYDKEGKYAGEKVYSEGLEQIAGKIRRAKLLRVRMNTRGATKPGDSVNPAWSQIRVPVEGDARVEDGKIRLEVKNGTEKAISYYALGAVLSDAQGCIVDVLDEKTVDIAPGESVTLEKELLPYATAEMLEGATLEIFGYVFAKDLDGQ